MTFLSKSKYLAGLQCSKLLWYHYNAREEIPPPDDATQALFDQGHLVGELAKSLYPDGIDVAKETADFDEVLRQSLEAVSARKPLFEAAFRYRNAYARADILNPVGKVQWDIIEVKSSTEVKDANIHDLAIQWYAYEGAGLRIRKSFLMHINNEYVRKGAVEPKKLFILDDVTAEVRSLLPDVEKNLRKMIEVIRLKKHPEIAIGPQCTDPYDCPLRQMCWAFLPPHNVMSLVRLGHKGFELLGHGIQKIVDIPDQYRLSGSQKIQQRAIRDRRPVVDKHAIASFLRELKYPLYFLDFETFQSAIPPFDGTRPFQQIPFQFSLHVVASKGAGPEHHGFLSSGRLDPRPEILAQLKKLIGNSGSIVCYNASFEKSCLQELVRTFSQYGDWWEAAEPRVIDLLTPFRNFSYYHPDQEGSASIKAVLPALTGKGYDGMAIADGGAASREYLRVTFGEVTDEERETVRRQLEKYCALDTGGMILIIEALQKL
jgi:hypothetical protein